MRSSRHIRLVDEYVGIMFENGLDRLKKKGTRHRCLDTVLYQVERSWTYLVLDCRADETILPIHTVRGSGGEQCGPKDNREITYRH